ncbi:MAG: AAA family ATPase [Acidobacteriota bacterium]
MAPYQVTIIGAESTGKTTLSRQLADILGGDWLCEFARPYLEVTDGEVSRASMQAIWHGQHAMQHVALSSPRPYVVQDTDLYATIGYWRLPHVTPRIGDCPKSLEQTATELASDLYLITKSNIAFAPDPLRYGGDRRESPDSYWIRLCESYKLPYVVIEASDEHERVNEALQIIERSMSCEVS